VLGSSVVDPIGIRVISRPDPHPDSHQGDKSNPDPHHGDKSNPDPDPEKRDADPQHCSGRMLIFTTNFDTICYYCAMATAFLLSKRNSRRLRQTKCHGISTLL
jgi:hypothetical protein